MVYVDNQININKDQTKFMDMVQYNFTIKNYIIEGGGILGMTLETLIVIMDLVNR